MILEFLGSLVLFMSITTQEILGVLSTNWRLKEIIEREKPNFFIIPERLMYPKQNVELLNSYLTDRFFGVKEVGENSKLKQN